ncbi:MAG: A/G-specific adenine glycosylase [Pseudarcicella sp.]|nr:A/G-specific adenine glycosylase [Pseudarcicella sp.]
MSHTSTENNSFSNILLKWYQIHKRDLPWRNTKSPYLVWLSEVILQQTRVAQGLPYYNAFSTQYPSVELLAAASQDEVLRLWQGLGYYSRARNMHNTAKQIVNEHNGFFPDSYSGLLKLKGIGPYTAAAIASFCYQEKVAVVDGNVYRVLARVFGETTDISTGTGKKTFQNLADKLINKQQPDIHNQSIMEFGALHCTPKSYQCGTCPLATTCVANISESQHLLPVKTKKLTIKQRNLNYLVFVKEEKIFLKQRHDNDIWAGLFDFFEIETTHENNIENILENQFLDELKSNISTISEPYILQHILTHQKIKAFFYIVTLNENFSDKSLTNGKFYNISEIENLAKPVLISNFLNKYFS